MELVYGDAAKTGLADNSASVVSLCLVVHELSRDARKEVRVRDGSKMHVCTAPSHLYSTRSTVVLLTRFMLYVPLVCLYLGVCTSYSFT